MTQVLHTPLGQPIFVGDSQQTTRLLQAGLPLHILPQTVQIAGLQARPQTAPVQGKKLSSEATIPPKEAWAKPREVAIPKPPDAQKRKETKEKYTFKLKPTKKPPVEPPAAAAPPVIVPEPAVAAPTLVAEEPVKSHTISEILSEAKRRQKELRDKELYEAEKRKQEQARKEERIQRLMIVAEQRRTQSQQNETRHPMAWGANQKKSSDEQKKIKECADIRRKKRELRQPLPEDRVGLGDFLEAKREMNQPIIIKKPKTPAPPSPPKPQKDSDPSIEEFMRQKQLKDRRKAQEEEYVRQQSELERLMRLQELDQLRKQKLSVFKARQRANPMNSTKLKEAKAKRKRIKALLAKARAKLQSSQSDQPPASSDPAASEPASTPLLGTQDIEEELSSEAEDASEIRMKPTNLSTPQQETEDTDFKQRERPQYPGFVETEPIKVTNVIPAAFTSDAALRGAEKYSEFQRSEKERDMDLAARKAEIRRKLSELQRRIASHAQEEENPTQTLVVSKFAEEPLAVEQDIPGVKSMERTYIAAHIDKPVAITIEAPELPGVSLLSDAMETLTPEAAAITVQKHIRAFLARRRVDRLRVRRSIAEADPEVQRQLQEMDKEVLKIMQQAYAPVKLAPEPKGAVATSRKVEEKEKVREEKRPSVNVKLNFAQIEDEYSLLKVVLRSGALQVVEVSEDIIEEEVHSIREDTQEYSESFETPSKSSQENSARSRPGDVSIKEKIDTSQSYRRDDPRRSPISDFHSSHSSHPNLRDSSISEELLSSRAKSSISEEILSSRAKPESSVPEEIYSSRRPGESSILEDIESARRRPDSSISEEISSYRRRPESSISEEILTSKRRQESSISEKLSVEDLSAQRAMESISEDFQGASVRRSTDESVSERLSVGDLSKSSRHDSSRKPLSGKSVSESIAEELFPADLSRSRGGQSSGSIAEVFSSRKSQDSSLKQAGRAGVQASGSISEDISASGRLHGTSELSISEHFSAGEESKSIPAALRTTDSIAEEVHESQSSSSKSIPEEVSRSSASRNSSLRPKYDSPGIALEDPSHEDSIIEEISHAHGSIDSLREDRHKDSENIKTVEDYSEDFESESIAMSQQARKPEVKDNASDSVSEQISEYQSDFESSSVSKSEQYSSDFEASASHKRFDSSISPEKQQKGSIEEEEEEEDIEEEFSEASAPSLKEEREKQPEHSSAEDYEDDFESSSQSQSQSQSHDETLKTSSSLPRSTIGGDPEASQASDSIEWELELPPHPILEIPEEVEEILTEPEEAESQSISVPDSAVQKAAEERQKQVESKVDAIVELLLREAIAVVKTQPREEKKKESSVDSLAALGPLPPLPALPALPPLPQKTAAVASFMPSAQAVTQDLTALATDLLDQALRNKAVLAALTKPPKSAPLSLLDKLKTPQKPAPVLDDKFFSVWSMQGELMESGSMTEEFQGKKTLSKVAFDAVNEVLSQYREEETLPWSHGAEVQKRKFDSKRIKAEVEKTVKDWVAFRFGKIAENQGQMTLDALDKQRKEDTAKLLELDMKAEEWSAYDRFEDIAKLEVAELLLKHLAGEVVDLLNSAR